MISQPSKSLIFALNNSMRRKLPFHPAAATASCHLTTATSNAVHKLQAVVEQYRVENYSQELPSRCKKEIVLAADTNKDGQIDVRKLGQILYNIGAGESLSKQDLRNIIQELGNPNNGTISPQQMLQIL